MSLVTSELNQAESDLKREGRDISILRRVGAAIPRIAEQGLECALAQFHNLAGQFPYWADCDLGALILEEVADDMPPNPRRSVLYQHATYRAEWCASAATAGGEGIARSQHLARVRQKLSAEQGASTGRRDEH